MFPKQLSHCTNNLMDQGYYTFMNGLFPYIELLLANTNFLIPTALGDC